MSLVSASGFVGGIKEYGYRGMQQLPLILASTSLIFAITTGSIAHANIVFGMGILIPIYTSIMQYLCGKLLNTVMPNSSAQWSRSTGDTCNIIPIYGKKPFIADYISGSSGAESVPSYWLMSVAFFIGYSISNAVDNLETPAHPFSDKVGVEKRTTHSIFVIVATSIFSFILLFTRFTLMRGCEGRGGLGMFFSIINAGGAAAIGYGVYTLSRKCGARSSDLFGILSQVLPASATTPNPIVCSSD
jgi:hypothetical protein